METKHITKAVIAAAGTGTRFLPQTKAMPKEMLPIMGKPIIQWVVEELVSVGATDIIIVTGAQKRALEDHFDRSIELEQDLRKKGKTAEADEIQRVAEMANFIYLRQKAYNDHTYGTAVPLMNARHLIGDEPFFFVSADDLFVSTSVSRAQQMCDAYKETGKSVIAGLEIDQEESYKYGMLDLGNKLGDGIYQLNGLIEKPAPEDAPSNYMTIMWYLLTPEIFDHIDSLEPDKAGELVAAEAVGKMCANGNVTTKVLDGVYHDCGNYVSYLKASLHFASQYENVHQDISQYVKETILNDD